MQKKNIFFLHAFIKAQRIYRLKLMMKIVAIEECLKETNSVISKLVIRKLDFFYKLSAVKD